jgi:hypothetical protein
MKWFWSNYLTNQINVRDLTVMLNANTDHPAPGAAIEQAYNMLKNALTY